MLGCGSVPLPTLETPGFHAQQRTNKSYISLSDRCCIITSCHDSNPEKISYLDPFSLVAPLLRTVFRPDVGSDFSSVGDPNPALK